jgi:hypothetical protein
MSTTRESGPQFHVGDWVSFLYGAGRVVAQVVEDRGPLGVNRRRLYRIRLDQDAAEPVTFEMPEEEMQPTPVPSKEQVLRYLRGGGLVQMLRSNLSGGPNPPRIWLTFTPLGDVTHTFLADRGLLGGGRVPFSALYGDKVFAPKECEVLEFVLSFGVSRAEAKELLHEVGTAP